MDQIPSSIKAAVRLMYLGALAGLISLLAGMPDPGALRETVRASAPPGDADVAATFAVAGLWITVGLMAAGTTALWLGVAHYSGKGRPWARTVATVLFGIYTVFVILAFTGVGAMTSGGLAMWASLVTWLIGLAVVILLYRRESRAFYRNRVTGPGPQP